ncbi:MAG TPA: DNA-binding domain-containing protein [Methylomirabilota bacterium]|nr:DNA-binding domain-containing protein [Methylomirabilota bacterium]
MLTLAELQRLMAATLLGGDAEAVGVVVAPDGLSPEARLAIYRHHVRTSLTAVLKDVYPVVCHLVDDRFFGYAADAYLRGEPPAEPRLFVYGAGFADFLAGFPPCHGLPYLPDVARLEWALHAAYHAAMVDAPEAPALAAALGALTPDETARVVFTVDPSARYLASPYPVDRIWRANQPGADPEARVELDAGPVHLEVRRVRNEAVLRSLAPAEWTLRARLTAGQSLEDAGAEALAADARLDLAAALSALFTEGLLVDFTLNPVREETHPC